MLTRNLPGHTLASLKDQIADGSRGALVVDLALGQIDLKLDAADPTIALGGVEVPATRSGLTALAGWLGVPTPFFRRWQDRTGASGAQELLDRMIETSGVGEVSVTYTEHGIRDVNDVGRQIFDPIRLVGVAGKVLGTEDAVVTRLVDESTAFSFDVRVPDEHHAVGGDPRVGDVTAGGLAVGYDRKRNLTPTVQPYLYRLVCTNGMVCVDPGLKVDARGSTVDEVMAELEAAAELAFSRVERQIAHLYELREEPVPNPERELRVLARERKIPDRTATALLDLATSEALPDNPTRFDLVNLVTNLANSPLIVNDGGRRLLEVAGGAVVVDAEHRCGHCRQRTTH
jgi:predicted RNase H-like HicB family nuclease